jgi:hypothetical protein
MRGSSQTVDFPDRKPYAAFPTRKVKATVEHDMTPLEARAALDTVERGRLRVVEEIDLPRWYWWGLAVGWIALGFVTDLQHPWLTTAATFAFGAVHASVAARVADGRHRSGRLAVSRAVAGRHAASLVISGLIGLALLTIAGALAASADGAGHPVTIASVPIAVLLVLGGPQLLAVVRRRAAARAA